MKLPIRLPVLFFGVPQGFRNPRIIAATRRVNLDVPDLGQSTLFELLVRHTPKTRGKDGLWVDAPEITVVRADDGSHFRSVTFDGQHTSTVSVAAAKAVNAALDTRAAKIVDAMRAERDLELHDPTDSIGKTFSAAPDIASEKASNVDVASLAASEDALMEFLSDFASVDGKLYRRCAEPYHAVSVDLQSDIMVKRHFVVDGSAPPMTAAVYRIGREEEMLDFAHSLPSSSFGSRDSDPRTEAFAEGSLRDDEMSLGFAARHVLHETKHAYSAKRMTPNDKNMHGLLLDTPIDFIVAARRIRDIVARLDEADESLDADEIADCLEACATCGESAAFSRSGVLSKTLMRWNDRAVQLGLDLPTPGR